MTYLKILELAKSLHIHRLFSMEGVKYYICSVFTLQRYMTGPVAEVVRMSTSATRQTEAKLEVSGSKVGL